MTNEYYIDKSDQEIEDMVHKLTPDQARVMREALLAGKTVRHALALARSYPDDWRCTCQ